MLLYLSLAAGLLMAVALFRLFFEDFHDFIECVRFWFQPDIISLLRNEWQEDMWGTMKLIIWFGLSLVMGCAAFYKLPHIFPSLAASRPAISTPASAIKLPTKPYTKEHVPLLTRRIEALKVDAKRLNQDFRQDTTKDHQAVKKLWEEIFYAPDFYPAIVKMRTVETARVAKLRPDLAEHIRIIIAYQDGHFSIVTNTAITDKAAAIRVLKDSFGSALKNPEYSRYRKQFGLTCMELIGDVEFDEADRAYRQSMKEAMLKRNPALAEHFRQSDRDTAAYNALMAEANALSREIKILKGEKHAPANVVRAAEISPSAITNARARAEVAVQPTHAAAYDVKVGDTVEISALKPAVALRRALITRMDNEQLIVSARGESYTIQWKDVTRLRPETRK